jgi:hypothetical protein
VRVGGSNLALEDRDQWVALIAAAKEHVPDARRPLLAVLGGGPTPAWTAAPMVIASST